MKKYLSIFIIVILTSCSDINFIYKGERNLTNLLYGHTKVETSGFELPFLNSYIPMFFGSNKKNEFQLLINVEQKKTKRSVKTNQVASNITYELRFLYTLKTISKNCDTFKKEIMSRFTIIPKSSGYNYGTDASLEKKYELIITDNLNRFISSISDRNIKNCL